MAAPSPERRRAAARVDISPRELPAAPDQPCLVFVTIYNAGDVIDGFAVGLVGDDELRGVPDLEVLSLFPDTEGSVALNVLPDRWCTAGVHRATVQVTSTVDGVVVHEEQIAVDVAAVISMSVGLEPQAVTGGSRARFSVLAENQGNVAVTLHLAAQDPERALASQFNEVDVDVGPSERVVVPFAVRGRRPFLGAPVPRVVTVRAVTTSRVPTPEPPPVLEAVGTFVQRPLLPRALLTLVALLLALGMWAAVLLQGVDRAASQVADEVAGAGTSMIVGRVTDGTSGLGGVAIAAAGPSSATTTTLTAGDVGSFTLRELQGGASYVLTITMDGYASITYEVPVPPGDGGVVSTGSIVLGRGSAGVSGTVADPAGAPVGDVAVVVRRGDDLVARAVTASSGAVGFYAIGGLAPGTYTVTFERFGFTATSVQVDVEPDQLAAADAVLVPAATGRMTGAVSAVVERVPACGPPPACGVGGVAVRATLGEATFTASTLSSPAGSEGRWVLEALPPGRYTLEFAREGFQTQVLSATLGVGQAISVDVRLLGAPGTITGAAVGCSSVEVRRRDLSRLDPPVAAVPTSDGSFTISQLPSPGQYRLILDGPVLRTVDVDLAAGETRAITASCEQPSTSTTSTSTTTTTTSTTEPPAATDIIG